MGNVFGNLFRFVTWGESHGPALGVVIDGCPSGLPFDADFLRAELDRDVPDKSLGTTRNEPNSVEILSGVFEGVTLGTPISVLIRNEDTCHRKYLPMKELPRPGHGDYTYRARYSHVDWRGGSRASGRECVCRAVAGAVAKMMLARCGIEVTSRIIAMAGIDIDSDDDYEKARERAIAVGEDGDSTGGAVEVTASGLPPGVGSPLFGKLEATLACAMMSIGGVMAFEMGAGIDHADLLGSESNDPFALDDGEVVTATNNAGGVQGGISNGMDVVMRLTVKPTPSIAKPQRTVNLKTGEAAELSAEGRFDYNYTPRVCLVAEAMAAAVVVDALIESGLIHPVRFGESPLLRKSL